jgi:hypothetical protein
MNAHTAPRFPIYIRGLEGDFRPEERAFIQQKLTRRLNKFAESIERVSGAVVLRDYLTGRSRPRPAPTKRATARSSVRP